MLLRDQIVIQIGEELDGMVMIRSGDNRQGVCPLKFLQEVWQHTEVACQVNNACACTTNWPQTNQISKKPLTKIYYPTPRLQAAEGRRNNEIHQGTSSSSGRVDIPRRSLNSSNILHYYYNNINNNESYPSTNPGYFQKQSSININNIFAISNNQKQKVILEKNHLSSTKRPLAFSRHNPHSNYFMKTFRSDSQKRPLLLNYPTPNTYHGNDNNFGPNFKIIPEKTGLKISPIYSISQDIDKYVPSRRLRHQSSYFRNYNYTTTNLLSASSSRPLYLKK